MVFFTCTFRHSSVCPLLYKDKCNQSHLAVLFTHTSGQIPESCPCSLLIFFFFNTVPSSAAPSHWLGLSSQPSHLNYCHSCFVVNHSPCFTTPDPSSACPTKCILSNSVLSCLIVFAALITEKVDFQTLIGKGNFSVSL